MAPYSYNGRTYVDVDNDSDSSSSDSGGSSSSDTDSGGGGSSSSTSSSGGGGGTRDVLIDGEGNVIDDNLTGDDYLGGSSGFSGAPSSQPEDSDTDSDNSSGSRDPERAKELERKAQEAQIENTINSTKDIDISDKSTKELRNLRQRENQQVIKQSILQTPLNARRVKKRRRSNNSISESFNLSDDAKRSLVSQDPSLSFSRPNQINSQQAIDKQQEDFVFSTQREFASGTNIPRESFFDREVSFSGKPGTGRTQELRQGNQAFNTPTSAGLKAGSDTEEFLLNIGASKRFSENVGKGVSGATALGSSAALGVVKAPEEAAKLVENPGTRPSEIIEESKNIRSGKIADTASQATLLAGTSIQDEARLASKTFDTGIAVSGAGSAGFGVSSGGLVRGVNAPTIGINTPGTPKAVKGLSDSLSKKAGSTKDFIKGDLGTEIENQGFTFRNTRSQIKSEIDRQRNSEGPLDIADIEEDVRSGNLESQLERIPENEGGNRELVIGQVDTENQGVASVFRVERPRTRKDVVKDVPKNAERFFEDLNEKSTSRKGQLGGQKVIQRKKTESEKQSDITDEEINDLLNSIQERRPRQRDVADEFSETSRRTRSRFDSLEDTANPPIITPSVDQVESASFETSTGQSFEELSNEAFGSTSQSQGQGSGLGQVFDTRQNTKSRRDRPTVSESRLLRDRDVPPPGDTDRSDDREDNNEEDSFLDLFGRKQEQSVKRSVGADLLNIEKDSGLDPTNPLSLRGSAPSTDFDINTEI